MYFLNEMNGRSEPNSSGSNHLCEAFALCQSILKRYRRAGTDFSEAELKAIDAVRALLPATSDVPSATHNSNSGILSNAGTSSKSFLDSLDETFVNPSNEANKIMRLLETYDDITKSPKDVFRAINNEVGAVVGSTCTRTYFFARNDDLLMDPINGVACAANDSSPLGKSVAMTNMYTIANTLYIPLIAGGHFVGCVEAPGGRANRHHHAYLLLLLKATAVIIRNMESARVMSWGTQKAEAMLTMATRLARDTLDEAVLVQSIMNTAKELTESDRCSIFIVQDDKSLEAHFEDGNVVTIPAGVGIAGHVASTGEVVNIANAYEDERFNRQVDKATGYHTKSILCLPVMYEGTIVAVAQLINKLDLITDSELHLPRLFGQRDVDLFETFSMFAAASLRNCRINDNLMSEKKKSDAILDVVTLLSNTDIRDVDGIVRHVLHGAKKLLNADRSSLFLLDKERNELYSRMADSVSGNEIRFPSGQGIAGTVAASGVGENIIDAYRDDRFNSSVDKQLGYRTQSILCEPIILNGEVLAVVQLVNKLGVRGEVAAFSENDRHTFRVFSLFAGISINNSHLLEFAVQAGREAMELNEMRSLGRQTSTKTKLISISPNERREVLETTFDKEYDFTSVNFNLFELRERAPKSLDAAAAMVFKLLWDTGLPRKFGCREETLLNFILQCRKKYRFVPYHNFFHVTDVCQTLHTFLYAGRACEYLTELECYVLLITALVHDLDHMGVNNSFYLKTDSPLGILSSASGNSSVLEVHHCNLAIEILSDPEADVFEGLDPDDVRYAYRALIDCILATDMAKHSDEVKAFLELVKAGFDKEEEGHRRKVMEMLIKAGDVSNVTKPFETSRLWAMSVTEEFYRQGDMEKEKGVEVLPMFDRSLNNELAKGQIGFIDFVAGKFIKDVVSNFFHGMQWCIDNVESNRASWKAILDNATQ